MHYYLTLDVSCSRSHKALPSYKKLAFVGIFGIIQKPLLYLIRIINTTSPTWLTPSPLRCMRLSSSAANAKLCFVCLTSLNKCTIPTIDSLNKWSILKSTLMSIVSVFYSTANINLLWFQVNCLHIYLVQHICALSMYACTKCSFPLHYLPEYYWLRLPTLFLWTLLGDSYTDFTSCFSRQKSICYSCCCCSSLPKKTHFIWYSWGKVVKCI